ncbi:MAG TPA: ABC transporter substrate-binding protein [Acidimicrobiales bacterium]|nr:ABC transporter substrate-binding protein [Acidimicrobiales bacterium]
MGSTFDRRTLLAGGAVAAAGFAGASALDWGSFAGAAASGSGRNGISKAKPKRGGHLIMGVDAEEVGFDPTQGHFDEVGVMYARTVFDPLTIVTANGGWAPYLAQSVTPNANLTSWTITLRPNVLFHDGTPCNGAALLTNMQAQAKSLLVGIVLTPILVSMSQTGPLAVTLNFKTPWAPFPYWLAGSIGGQIAYVAAPSMLANKNGTSHPVGTGPFVFSEWVPNSHFTATANPHYWRPGLPYLNQITFKPIPDENARAEALKTKTIHLMHTDTPQVFAQFRGDRSFSYIDDSNPVGEPDMSFVMLNCQAPPFNNPAVRRAAAMAIDRKQYTKVVDINQEKVANGLFAPGTPNYSNTAYPKFNQGAAKHLVAQVARSTGAPVAFTLGGTTGPGSIRQQEYLQQAFQAVGFKVTNQTVLQNDIINTALAGKYQALAWRQFVNVDPDLNYVFWSTTTVSSGIPLNFARNSDPKIEAALQLGRTSTNRSVRRKAYQTVNQRMGIDLPYLWLDQGVWSFIGLPNVQNFNNPTTPGGGAALGQIGGSIWPTQIWLS